MNWLKKLLGGPARPGNGRPDDKATAAPAAPDQRSTPLPVAPHALLLFGPVSLKILEFFAVPLAQKMESGHVYVDRTTGGLATSSIMADPSATLDSVMIVHLKPRPAWLARGPAVMQGWSAAFERELQAGVRRESLSVRGLAATYLHVEKEDILITTIKAAPISCGEACALARTIESAGSAAR